MRAAAAAADEVGRKSECKLRSYVLNGKTECCSTCASNWIKLTGKQKQQQQQVAYEAETEEAEASTMQAAQNFVFGYSRNCKKPQTETELARVSEAAKSKDLLVIYEALGSSLSQTQT